MIKQSARFNVRNLATKIFDKLVTESRKYRYGNISFDIIITTKDVIEENSTGLFSFYKKQLAAEIAKLEEKTDYPHLGFSLEKEGNKLLVHAGGRKVNLPDGKINNFLFAILKQQIPLKKIIVRFIRNVPEEEMHNMGKCLLEKNPMELIIFKQAAFLSENSLFYTIEHEISHIVQTFEFINIFTMQQSDASKGFTDEFLDKNPVSVSVPKKFEKLKEHDTDDYHALYLDRKEEFTPWVNQIAGYYLDLLQGRTVEDALDVMDYIKERVDRLPHYSDENIFSEIIKLKRDIDSKFNLNINENMLIAFHTMMNKNRHPELLDLSMRKVINRLTQA